MTLTIDPALPGADILTIKRMIPHRYPFLLIDRVVNIEVNRFAVGLKNVTVNEPHFAGHFPARPVMPGVLIIEAMAQTSAVLVVETLKLLVQRGCRADEILVAIGPHISVRAFEVSPEVAAEIQAAAPGKAVVSYDFGSRPHCDLRSVARAQLLTEGVVDAHVDDVFGCTMSDSGKFFSYRRDAKSAAPPYRRDAKSAAPSAPASSPTSACTIRRAGRWSKA